jgi:hypothetical protein
MRKQQLGVSLGGLIVGLFVLIMAALLGLKLAPSYMEYYTVKKAVTAIADEKRGSAVSEIRKAFESRAVIDDITAVRAADLEITKEGNDIIVSVQWRKEVHLFGNIGVVMDFDATSRP